MKTKTFDCVAMKRRGAEVVQQDLAGLTPEEELAYWQSGTEELQQRQRDLGLLRPVDAPPTASRTPGRSEQVSVG